MFVILDIDNTLIDTLTEEEYKNSIEKIHRKYDYYLETYKLYIWERKGLQEFLTFLKNNVEKLGIWTNGTNVWLHFVLQKIISKYIPPSRFCLLYSVEKSDNVLVDRIDDSGNVYQTKVFLKNLDNIYFFNRKKGVLIDDNYYNCYYNKNNAIPIKKFLIRNGIEDKELKKTIFIIKTLLHCKDVNVILKRVYESIDYNQLFTNLF